MPVYSISIIGGVVTFGTLVVMLLTEEHIRPQRRLWRTLNIIVFIGVLMIFGGIFAAGLVTTPTTPRSEFGAW